MLKWLKLTATCLICACCASAPLAHAFGSVRLAPEGWYKEIYGEVRDCSIKLNAYSGLRYEQIEWYITQPLGMSSPQDSIYIAGIASSPNRIYLDPSFVMNGDVVRHELAHLLLRRGHNGHMAPEFNFCLMPAPTNAGE